VSKHAYDLKTSSRKHVNKHTIQPQLTDSVFEKISESRARSFVIVSRSNTHGRVILLTVDDFPSYGRDPSTTVKFLSIRVKFSWFKTIFYQSTAFRFSLASKMKMGEKWRLFIVRLSWPMQHRLPPHVWTAAAHTGDICHGGRHGDKWRRVSLHRPISFGSKTQPTSASRLVTLAARHQEWGVHMAVKGHLSGQTALFRAVNLVPRDGQILLAAKVNAYLTTPPVVSKPEVDKNIVT